MPSAWLSCFGRSDASRALRYRHGLFHTIDGILGSISHCLHDCLLVEEAALLFAVSRTLLAGPRSVGSRGRRYHKKVAELSGVELAAAPDLHDGSVVSCHLASVR